MGDGHMLAWITTRLTAAGRKTTKSKATPRPKHKHILRTINLENLENKNGGGMSTTLYPNQV